MARWQSFQSFLAEAQETPLEQRQALVNALLREHPDWPWVEGRRATFIYARQGARNVAVNLDTIKADPPFAPMVNLPGTSLWYITRDFSEDDLLDYMLAVNDPMTPLAQEKNIVDRISRFWQTDPYNSARLTTPQMDVSVLRMGSARPFPDWSKMRRVNRGKIHEHTINSNQLNFKGHKLWIYTPPGYEDSGEEYPLLILNDGEWAAGPLQAPAIADVLIKHGQMSPVVIAMIQSGDQSTRAKTFISNDKHYAFTLTELLPFVQTHYRIDSTNLGIGGVDLGAIAAAHDALKNPAVFTGLIMISPPLGKGTGESQLKQYVNRFDTARVLPRRIFQSVGRYEARARFHLPGLALRAALQHRSDTAYRFAEIGSGHSLVAFRSILPEAMAWVFPGETSQNGAE